MGGCPHPTARGASGPGSCVPSLLIMKAERGQGGLGTGRPPAAQPPPRCSWPPCNRPALEGHNGFWKLDLWAGNRAAGLSPTAPLAANNGVAVGEGRACLRGGCVPGPGAQQALCNHLLSARNERKNDQEAGHPANVRVQ